MRPILQNGQRVGNEERSDSAGLLIGVDDVHRLPCADFLQGSVGVGQAKRELAVADINGDLLIAAKDLNLIGLEPLEEGFSPIVVPSGEQASCMGSSRTEERLRDCDMTAPFRVAK